MEITLESLVPHVYRFAYRLSGSVYLAEELTQEACLRAWTRQKHLRNPNAARVYLFRIVANLWKDRLRRSRSPIAQAGSLNGSEPDRARVWEQRFEQREELDRALAAMHELPDRQRETLYLHACEQLSCAEIAEVLGISPEAAKSSLSLARKKIRELLGEPGAASRLGK